MIQRIQTIFLLLATILMGLNFKFPFANSPIAGDGIWQDKIFSISDQPLLMGGLCVIAILLLISIFLYNNRQMQKILVMAGLLLLLFYIGYIYYHIITHSDYNFDFGAFTPIVSAILLVLAVIYINKDDKIVKSMDRLR